MRFVAIAIPILSVVFLAACSPVQFQRAANVNAAEHGGSNSASGTPGSGVSGFGADGSGVSSTGADGSATPAPLQQCENNGNFTSSPNSAGRTIVYQSNSSNQSSIVQVGSNNFAQVTQVGSDNISCIYQSGTNNSATVSQTGSGNNSASTVQISGSDPSVLSDPASGQQCLCDMLSYCQANPSASLCQSLE